MTCALDDQALADQLGRFTTIGRFALWARLSGTELTIVLDPALDDAFLLHTLDIERDCCPFFALNWNEPTRELTIVARPEHETALERVAQALDVRAVAA